MIEKHHTSCVGCADRNSNRPRPQSGRASLNINTVPVPRRFNWQGMPVLPSNNLQKYANVRQLSNMNCVLVKLGYPQNWMVNITTRLRFVVWVNTFQVFHDRISGRHQHLPIAWSAQGPNTSRNWSMRWLTLTTKSKSDGNIEIHIIKKDIYIRLKNSQRIAPDL